MTLSLIIVNYNAKEFLKNCLDSIFKYWPGNDLEIIVVDNNSADGSVNIIKSDFAGRVKLIANKKNIGFGPANNQGAEIATGEFLFFLYSDTIIKNDIFTPLKNIFSFYSRLAVASPRLVLPNGADQSYAFGRFPSLIGLLWQRICRRKVNFPLNGDLHFVDWVSGAAMVVRKNIFEQIGGFDKNFFMYFEDIDLCWRAKQLGWQIAVCPQISITHFVGQSAGGFRKRKKHYYQSQDYFFKKHYGRAAVYALKIFRWPYQKLLGI